MHFFDKTLSFLIIICSIIYLVEWILGASWQEKSKDKLISWWIKFDDLSFSKILPIPIYLGEKVLENIYKKTKKVYSFIYIRFFYVSIPVTIFMIFVLIEVGVGEKSDIFYNEVTDNLFVSIFEFVKTTGLTTKYNIIELISLISIMIYMSAGGLLYAVAMIIVSTPFASRCSRYAMVFLTKQLRGISHSITLRTEC